ncbi:TolC family protein [Rubritalea spongiae]|uniref:TolC family protein n=1 Tax=Rubritalea spongiae TaxID=430797 RepID=A0ABW5E462_9BACT
MKNFTIATTLSGALALSACSSTPELIIAKPEAADLSLSKDSPVNQSAKLKLCDIATRVSSNNPQLRAARLRIQEAQGQVVQAGRLSNPELEFDLNKNVKTSEGGLEVTFAQRFPITNRLRLEKHISSQQLAIAKEEIKVAQRALITQAQILAVEIIHKRQSAAYLKQQSAILNQFAKHIEDSVQEGVLSSLDANQAKVEAVTLESQLDRVRTEEDILLNKLKAYIGVDPARPLQLTGSLPTLKMPSATLILGNRPEYRAKLIEINQSEQQIALAKANRYQDVEGRIFTSVDREEDAPEGLETEGSVGVGVSVPLNFYNKNEGNIQSARASATRIVKEKEALALVIRQEVATQHAEMQSWLNQTQKLNNRLLPLADDNAEQLEKAYSNGQAPFTSVLKARSQQLALQSQNLSNQQAFHTARVRYFAAIGLEKSSF